MNRLFGLFLLALAVCAPNVANAATCFWVGGTGSINDVTHWSSGTGGAGSTCAAAGGWPNSTSDNATFDASSGAGTITRNVNWTITTITLSLFTGTFGNSGDTASVDFLAWQNSGAGTRTVNLGASTWTCSNASGCNWSQTGATNLTFNANTSTLSIVGGNFNPGATPSPTYNVVTFAGGVPGTNIVWNGSGTTVTTLNIVGSTYFFMTNAQNASVTNMNFSGGSLSSWVGFATAASNSQFTFTLANPVTCSYCMFRNITAATNAITASQAINNGANVNITFSSVPSGGGGGGGRIIGG